MDRIIAISKNDLFFVTLYRTQLFETAIQMKIKSDNAVVFTQKNNQIVKC